MIRDVEQMMPHQLEERARVMAGRAVGRASESTMARLIDSPDLYFKTLVRCELRRREALEL